MPVREVPATPAAVGTLRRWIEQYCDDAGVTGALRADVALAASEALTNVVTHAYVGRSPPGLMRIRADHVDHRVLVEVEDDGVGLRPRVDSPGGGLGLALIASLASELEFTGGSTGVGTLVRMTFAVL